MRSYTTPLKMCTERPRADSRRRGPTSIVMLDREEREAGGPSDADRPHWLVHFGTHRSASAVHAGEAAGTP